MADKSAAEAKKKAEQEQWRADRDKEINKVPVLGGETTITSVPVSAANKENDLKSQGQKDIGRNPEDIAADGEKRKDWDPIKK